MRKILFAAITMLFLCVPSNAQGLTVSNHLNPDALPARDALTAISGVTFADSSVFLPLGTATTLNGVQVWVEDELQPIRSVTPDKVVFVLSRRGGVQTRLRVRTQSGEEFVTTFRAVDWWPGVQITGAPDSAENQNFIPLAIYMAGTIFAPVGNDPIPVGPFGNSTVVVLHGSGWRNSGANVRVRLNGIECRVTAVGAHQLWPGVDVIGFEIPSYLANNGAMDVVVFVGNRASNFARIYLGEPTDRRMIKRQMIGR
ncbi:MAG TPA: IPT/TIG domain-containing protein [Blastocatellia bacterium]